MDILSIIRKAENYKQQGLLAIEAKIKLFFELKVVNFSDIRLLVNLAYIGETA